MTVGQDGGRTLAVHYLTMLDEHGPGAVDGFVAIDYTADSRSTGTKSNLLGLFQQFGMIPAFDLGST